MRRETFLASLDLTRELLKGLGYSNRVADRAVKTFRAHDERRLIEDYKLASDVDKLQERARSSNAMLEKLFREDEVEEAKLAQAENGQREAKVQREARSRHERLRPLFERDTWSPKPEARECELFAVHRTKSMGAVDGVPIPR